MKVKKILSVLLASAVLTAAAVPMMASAAGDVININAQEGMLKVTGENTGDEVCKAEFNGESVKLTFGASGGSDSSVYTAFGVAEEIVVDLTKTPVLYWDTEGEAQFNILMRFLNSEGSYDPGNNKCLINLAELNGSGSGISTGKGSLDIAKALKDADLGEGQTTISLSVIKYRVVGSVGSSVTINKLYFGAEGSEDVTVPTSPIATAAPEGGDTATTAAPADNTATTAAAKATTAANAATSPNTGDATDVLALAVVALAAAGGVLVCSRKAK